MGKLLAALLAGIFSLCLTTNPAAAQSPSITAEAWQAYKAKFLDPGGRIIDDGNGNISHSEGQGYGLLLSFLAGSQPDFELIWAFTRTEMLLRNDGLIAWKWNPGTKPHVTDINNATDGDILVAYALGLAGQQWKRRDYTAAGSRLARAILERTVVQDAGRTLLLPGATGFSAGDREDGPIINPSYWIFEAFPVLDQLAPSPEWAKLRDEGVALINALRFGPRQLPSDWVSLKSPPGPATGFPSEYGYNALRIPLYLVRGGVTDRELLTRLMQATSGANAAVTTIDINSGTVKNTLSDPGYRIVNHILACVMDKTALPADVKQFTPTLYYPSTLHLLGLSFVAAKQPECL
ncbi:glycosyl hydrolase family 8 [Pararhizobium sp. BT-229]|uniref:glycosyl hydrolase family 8 n=1 Tax=Pararhizobium sp. BT-229 TaxID=2986923 RepID=UPI0021F6C278|nr:glycosyl hydrolase family 8 [Pararhizobium sp. BT-229]MCV9967193.1 glycosyl hydrolase family 8 [Pararhizobium sp. BT-229]